MTAASDGGVSEQVSSAPKGTILQTFATPVARIAFPHAEELNEPLANVILSKLNEVDNKFSYKAETAVDMTLWGEPIVDSVSGWMLRMTRRFVETASGCPLDDAYAVAMASDRATFNSADEPEIRDEVTIGIGVSRSWASVYRRGDRHESHFHPNTAIAAIYYVAAPGACELDLVDPRTNIDYFDPGITIAGEGQNMRLKCKPGELILFPGWLRHSVPNFRDDGVRISMSWNLIYARRRKVAKP